jgi:hypothetical protein
LIGTNIIPHGMTYDELVAGFRDLIRRVTADAVIAERIRNKLPHLGEVPVPFSLSMRETLVNLGRFLVRGVLRGGPRRWYHFTRSLLPVVRRPRLLPFVVLNWVYGITIQSFVREHLRKLAEQPPTVAATPQAQESRRTKPAAAGASS